MTMITKMTIMTMMTKMTKMTWLRVSSWGWPCTSQSESRQRSTWSCSPRLASSLIVSKQSLISSWATVSNLVCWVQLFNIFQFSLTGLVCWSSFGCFWQSRGYEVTLAVSLTFTHNCLSLSLIDHPLVRVIYHWLAIISSTKWAIFFMCWVTWFGSIVGLLHMCNTF